MPRPTAVRPLRSSPGSWAPKASRWCTNFLLMLCELLMLWMHGAADVHGGQDREDEGLEDGDEDLESVEGHQQPAGHDGPDVGRREQRGREDAERGQEKMARQHVGEEPDGERQRPGEEEGDEL